MVRGCRPCLRRETPRAFWRSTCEQAVKLPIALKLPLATRQTLCSALCSDSTQARQRARRAAPAIPQCMAISFPVLCACRVVAYPSPTALFTTPVALPSSCLSFFYQGSHPSFAPLPLTLSLCPLPFHSSPLAPHCTPVSILPCTRTRADSDALFLPMPPPFVMVTRIGAQAGAAGQAQQGRQGRHACRRRRVRENKKGGMHGNHGVPGTKKSSNNE